MSKKKISNDEILQVALQLIDENGINNGNPQLLVEKSYRELLANNLQFFLFLVECQFNIKSSLFLAFRS